MAPVLAACFSMRQQLTRSQQRPIHDHTSTLIAPTLHLGRWRVPATGARTAPAPGFVAARVLVRYALAERGAPMPANSAAVGDERNRVGLIDLFGCHNRCGLGLPGHHRECCGGSENCELRHLIISPLTRRKVAPRADISAAEREFNGLNGGTMRSAASR